MRDTDYYLRKSVDWVAVNEMGAQIFKYGHFELLDDFILLAMSVINVVYSKYIIRHDDGAVAREDVIQSAVVALYQDMKYRWDKYISVDNYAEYIKVLARNIMLEEVYGYHNQYNSVEYDTEMHSHRVEDSYGEAENRIIVETFKSNVLERALRLSSYRRGYHKILRLIIERLYGEENPDLSDIRSRVRILGMTRETFNFLLDHAYYLYRLSYNYTRAEIKGNNPMIIRLNEIVTRMEDPMYRILATNYKDSIIPEIYAEFGEDFTQRFVKTFSNRTVVVPSYREFNDDLLGSTVYEIVRGDKENLREFSSAYGIPYRLLSRMYDRVSKQIESVVED